MSYITDRSESSVDMKIHDKDQGSGRTGRRALPRLASTAVALVMALSVVFTTGTPAFAATSPPGEEQDYQPERFDGDSQLTAAGAVAEARTLGRGNLLRAWRAGDGGNNLWFTIGDNLSAFQIDGAQSQSAPTVVPFGFSQWAIFHRGLNNHIYYGFLDESLRWSGWREVFGQTTTVTPSVTQLGPDHAYDLYMVYRGASTREVYGTYYNGFWRDPVHLGGITNHSPSVTWNQSSNLGRGALWALHTGTDGHVYMNTQNYGGNWLSWQNMGGVLNGPPAMAASSTGNMQMAGRAPDNHVWYQEVNNQGGHASGWTRDADTVTVGWSPFLVAVGAVIYTIVTASNDRRVWFKQSFNGNNW